MTSQRGPGPDWNIQDGVNQPIGESTEASLRNVYGALPSTGHLLWASNFDSNLNTLEGIGVAPAGSVLWHDDQLHSGHGSAKCRTGALLNDGITVLHRESLFTESIHGFALWVRPIADNPMANGRQRLEIGLSFNTFDVPSPDAYNYIAVRIVRDVGGHHLDYYNNAGVWVNSGLDPGYFHTTQADGHWTGDVWHYLKLQIDRSKFPTEYVSFQIDGRILSLAGIPCQSVPHLNNSNFLVASMAFTTLEANAKLLYTDDWALTDHEP